MNWVKEVLNRLVLRRASVGLATALMGIVAFTAATFLPAGNAEACGRCGLFGRACRFASHHVAQVVEVPVVQEVVAPYQQPSQAIVVQNNYPPANGALPLIAQPGNTVYGLQAAFQPYRLDPDAVLRQAAELTKAAQSLADQGLRGYSNTASLALTLSASQPAIQSAAQLQVGGQTGGQYGGQPAQLSSPLAISGNGAGYGAGGVNVGAGQSIRLTQNANGTWSLHAESLNTSIPGAAVAIPGGDVAGGVGGVGSTPVPGENPGVDPGVNPGVNPFAGVGQLVKKHCASCHGLDKSKPGGGVYFDLGHLIDCDTATDAVEEIKSGRMPKGGNLSESEKALLRLEIQDLTAKRRAG